VTPEGKTILPLIPAHPVKLAAVKFRVPCPPGCAVRELRDNVGSANACETMPEMAKQNTKNAIGCFMIVLPSFAPSISSWHCHIRGDIGNIKYVKNNITPINKMEEPPRRGNSFHIITGRPIYPQFLRQTFLLRLTILFIHLFRIIHHILRQWTCLMISVKSLFSLFHYNFIDLDLRIRYFDERFPG
jgi:hypothetical protein